MKRSFLHAAIMASMAVSPLETIPMWGEKRYSIESAHPNFERDRERIAKAEAKRLRKQERRLKEAR